MSDEKMQEAGPHLTVIDGHMSAANPFAAVTKKKRGFAAMSPDAVKAIARKGGIAAHAAGTAHEFSVEEARAAGSKGGRTTMARRAAAKVAVGA